MFCRLFVVDFRQGVLGQWKKYLLSVCFFIICSVIFYFKWENYWNDHGIMSYNSATLGDYLVSFFGGCDRYIFDPLKPFLFPVQWLVFVLLALFINLDYFAESLSGIGTQTLLQSKSHFKWWLSKCICSFINIVFYIATGVLVTVLSCTVLGGSLSLHIDSETADILEIFVLDPKSEPKQMYISYILVILSIFAICLIQLFLSLVLKPMSSFLCTCFILLISSYFLVPILPGNYAMAVRSSLYANGGLEPLWGFIYMGVMSIILIAAGGIYFARTDILTKGE